MRKHTPLVPTLMLGAVLAVGFAVVWTVGSFWLIGIGQQMNGDKLASESLFLTSQGEPLVRSYTRYGNWGGGWTFRDLSGKPLSAIDLNDNGLYTTYLPRSSDYEHTANVTWNERIRVFDEPRTPVVFWYLLHDGRNEGAAYFVGYDSESKSRVGFIGTTGFRDSMPPAEDWFPLGNANSIGSGYGTRVLCSSSRYVHTTAYPNEGNTAAHPYAVPAGSLAPWFVYLHSRDNRVYKVDLSQRSTQAVLTAPTLRSIGLQIHYKLRWQDNLTLLLARTDEAVLVLDADGKELRRYTTPEAMGNADFTWGETAKNEQVAYTSSPRDELSPYQRFDIIWTDPAGRQLRRETPELVTNTGAGPALRALAGVALPSPLPLGIFLWQMRARWHLDTGHAGSATEALGQTVAEFWPSLLIALVCSLVLALLCYQRQVTYAIAGPWRTLAPLLVLVFGLPAWIAYRYGHSWPVMKRCPSCGRAVPHNQEHCVACGAEFTHPELKGTEIFA